jgi:Ca-activated chloride channel family protein
VSWYRAFGTTELVFCIAFIVLYTLYVIRIVRIGRSLKTPYSSVFIKVILRTMVLALLIISMLGPSFGESKKEVKSVGKDIMM